MKSVQRVVPRIAILPVHLAKIMAKMLTPLREIYRTMCGSLSYVLLVWELTVYLDSVNKYLTALPFVRELVAEVRAEHVLHRFYYLVSVAGSLPVRIVDIIATLTIWIIRALVWITVVHIDALLNVFSAGKTAIKRFVDLRCDFFSYVLFLTQQRLLSRVSV